MSGSPAPLDGRRVVVTRSKEQAGELSDRLSALGATPIEVSTIAITPPGDGGAALRAAVASAGTYDQLVVASSNGARALLAAVDATPGGVLPPVACVGPSTAAVFAESPLVVNVIPERHDAEGLVEALDTPSRPGARLLLVQAEVARAVLAAGLSANGWQVERVVAYRTVDAVLEPDQVEAAAHADVITFTASSTVERFVRLAGIDAVPPAVITIGPVTSSTARTLGLEVAGEADPHTLDGLVDAVIDWVRSAAPPSD